MKAVVKVRRMFCQIAIKKMGYSGANVARFLGINTSAANRYNRGRTTVSY